MTAAIEISNKLVTQLGLEFPDSVARRWIPSFTPEELATPKITVRPASRRATRTKMMADREALIEIGVVQQLPANTAADADPFNDFTTTDAFDTIAEEIVNAFMPDGGNLANYPICGYRPRTVEQITLIDAELLRSKRQLLTIIVVTYQRLG